MSSNGNGNGSSKHSASECISEEDFSWLQAAQQAVEQAEATRSFVVQRIAAKYKFQPGDVVDITNGVIIRVPVQAQSVSEVE